MEPGIFCPLGNLCFWLPVKLVLGVAPGDENLPPPPPGPSPPLLLGVPGPSLLGLAPTLLPAWIMALPGSGFTRNPWSREERREGRISNLDS